MATDMDTLTDDAYERWLQDTGVIGDLDSPSEENLVRILGFGEQWNQKPT